MEFSYNGEAIDIGIFRRFLQPTFLPGGEYIMSIWAKYSLCIPTIILEEYEGKLKIAPYKWYAVLSLPATSHLCLLSKLFWEITAQSGGNRSSNLQHIL